MRAEGVNDADDNDVEGKYMEVRVLWIKIECACGQANNHHICCPKCLDSAHA